MGELLHVRLRVSDMGASVVWFEKLFGLEVVDKSISPDGNQLVFMELPGENTKLELAYSDGFGPIELQEDLFHLAFAIKSMEGFGKKIREEDIEFSWGPITTGSGRQIAFVDHPDGYEIELIETGS